MNILCIQCRNESFKDFKFVSPDHYILTFISINFQKSQLSPFFPLIAVPVHLYICGGGDEGIAVCHRLCQTINRVGEAACRNHWCMSPGLSSISRCHWSVGRVQPIRLILILKSGPNYGMLFPRPSPRRGRCPSCAYLCRCSPVRECRRCYPIIWASMWGMLPCHMLGWDGVGCGRLARVLSTHAPSVFSVSTWIRG